MLRTRTVGLHCTRLRQMVTIKLQSKGPQIIIILGKMATLCDRRELRLWFYQIEVFGGKMAILLCDNTRRKGNKHCRKIERTLFRPFLVVQWARGMVPVLGGSLVLWLRCHLMPTKLCSSTPQSGPEWACFQHFACGPSNVEHIIEVPQFIKSSNWI